MKDFISDIVLENQEKFENSRIKYNDRYDVYGTTVQQFLYEGDKGKSIYIFTTVTEKLMAKSRRSSRKYAV